MTKFKVTLNFQAQVTYDVEAGDEEEAVKLAKQASKLSPPEQDPTFYLTENNDLDPPQIEEMDE